MMELVALPVSISALTVKSMCCSKMAKTEGQSCKKQSPCKKQQKDCNSTSCCLNCPLCYMVTMTVNDESIKPWGTVKKEYPAFESNYLFTYYSTAWKPPNGC
jgi:hypothetical protein